MELDNFEFKATQTIVYQQVTAFVMYYRAI